MATAAGGRKFATLGGLAIGGLVIAGLGVWRYVHAEQREIQRIAARLMPCLANQIEVVASDASDTTEVHRVRGCGMEATVICSAPDFECVLDPVDAVMSIPERTMP